MKSFMSAGAAVVVLLGMSMQAAASTPPSSTLPDDCKEGRPRAETVEKQALAATPRLDAPSAGRADARVTVEVWSDFECSFCARGADTLKALREKYGEQVRIVFRQNPLPAHPNARLAAIASMAAHEQGRFWEFHDALFAQQDALDRAALEALAGKLNLDVERFRRALDSSTWSNYVDMELVESKRRKIGATPTFFVNGQTIAGARPLNVFTQSIDAALAR
ncbi:DsbA family protein [Cystobacter fuscus]|uniref:DsbA family protein n=1 Tax=Cystobacter fuscus TaxID=43 RepID=UPI002B2DD817|nr:thioredoxin domain-containing protein [Cystobacter fuscus]